MKTQYTVKTDIKLKPKDGKPQEVIPSGSTLKFVEVKNKGMKWYVHLYSDALNRNLLISMEFFIQVLLNVKRPTIKTLEKWQSDSIANSIVGEKVELDGYDQYGFPSWVLYMGLI